VVAHDALSFCSGFGVILHGRLRNGGVLAVFWPSLVACRSVRFRVIVTVRFRASFPWECAEHDEVMLLGWKSPFLYLSVNTPIGRRDFRATSVTVQLHGFDTNATAFPCSGNALGSNPFWSYFGYARRALHGWFSLGA
jgi:hypothetical protein